MNWLDAVFDAFIVFCRLGGAFMVIPGFSSARVPMRFRLFAALVLAWLIAIATTPGAASEVKGDINQMAALIVKELTLGLMIGMVARIYLEALNFASNAIASYIGYGVTPGGAIDDQEVSTTLATMISVAAVTLFFMLDIHWQIVATLIQSYRAYPIDTPPEAQGLLIALVDNLSAAFILGLQLSSPFLIYGLILNVLFGLINKLVPNIPAYFVSIPFLIAGGLLIFHFAVSELLLLFASGVREGLTLTFLGRSVCGDELTGLLGSCAFSAHSTLNSLCA